MLRPLICLLLLATVAACVPVPQSPTATPRRDQMPQQPTAPPPPYQEPAIPVTADNAQQIAVLGRLDPPSTGVGSISAHAFSADGTRLSVLTQDLLIGWDLLSGEVVFFTNRLEARRVYFSVDKTEVYTLDNNGFIRVIDGETGNQLTTFDAQPNYSGDESYDAWNGRLALANQDGQVSVWDPLARDLLVRFDAENTRITDLAFSDDGQTLAIATANGAVELWDWQAREQITRLSTGENALGVERIALSPSGGQVAAGTAEDVRLWNVEENIIEHILLTGEGGAADVLSYTPDGRYVVNSGLADAMNIWDIQTGELVIAVPELGGDRTAASFNPAGDLMLASVFQGGAFLYDLTGLAEDNLQRAELSPPATIVGVGWSPDGRTLALFGTRGSAFIYGVADRPTPTPPPSDE